MSEIEELVLACIFASLNKLDMVDMPASFADCNTVELVEELNNGLYMFRSRIHPVISQGMWVDSTIVVALKRACFKESHEVKEEAMLHNLIKVKEHDVVFECDHHFPALLAEYLGRVVEAGGPSLFRA